MKKPNIRDLDLQDPQPPESDFSQGLWLGSAGVGVLFLVTLMWWVYHPLTLTEGDSPQERQDQRSQQQTKHPSTEQQP